MSVDQVFLPNNSQRFTSLDGLRGLAAAVVVIHHTMLLFPVVANPYLDRTSDDQSLLYRWLAYSPLHLLWDGDAAVYVFFVLSGFVLFLPLLRPGGVSWISYYPKRLVRLYLPIWVAVVFAAISITLVPRRGGLDSQWLIDRSHDVSIGAVLRDFTLVLGHGGLDSPLWSLRWEIIFSLALPIYFFVVRLFRKFSCMQYVFCLLLVAAGGYLGIQGLQYLPMFWVGAILARERFAVVSIFEGFSARRGSSAVISMLALFVVCLLMMPWWFRMIGASSEFEGASSAFVLMGASILVVLAMNWQFLRAALCLPIFVWLGGISFSLYLIHEPILIGVAFLLGNDYLLLSWVVSLPVCFAAAWIFHRWIERPSHGLARRFDFQWTPSRVGS